MSTRRTTSSIPRPLSAARRQRGGNRENRVRATRNGYRRVSPQVFHSALCTRRLNVRKAHYPFLSNSNRLWDLLPTLCSAWQLSG